MAKVIQQLLAESAVAQILLPEDVRRHFCGTVILCLRETSFPCVVIYSLSSRLNHSQVE